MHSSLTITLVVVIIVAIIIALTSSSIGIDNKMDNYHTTKSNKYDLINKHLHSNREFNYYFYHDGQFREIPDNAQHDSHHSHHHSHRHYQDYFNPFPPAPIPAPAVPAPAPILAPVVPPTSKPSNSPTNIPTTAPTSTPTAASRPPTFTPSQKPTSAPTMMPSAPSQHPTPVPTISPTPSPTSAPTLLPTRGPTIAPTLAPVPATVLPGYPLDNNDYWSDPINCLFLSAQGGNIQQSFFISANAIVSNFNSNNNNKCWAYGQLRNTVTQRWDLQIVNTDNVALYANTIQPSQILSPSNYVCQPYIVPDCTISLKLIANDPTKYVIMGFNLKKGVASFYSTMTNNPLDDIVVDVASTFNFIANPINSDFFRFIVDENAGELLLQFDTLASKGQIELLFNFKINSAKSMFQLQASCTAGYGILMVRERLPPPTVTNANDYIQQINVLNQDTNNFVHSFLNGKDLQLQTSSAVTNVESVVYSGTLHKLQNQQFYVLGDISSTPQSITFGTSNWATPGYSSITWKIAAFSLVPNANWKCSIGVEYINMDVGPTSTGYMMLATDTRLRSILHTDGTQKLGINPSTAAKFGIATSINLDTVATSNSYKNIIAKYFDKLGKNVGIMDLVLDVDDRKQGVLSINIMDNFATPATLINIPLFDMQWDCKYLAFRLKTECYGSGSGIFLIKDDRSGSSNAVSYAQLMSNVDEAHPIKFDRPLLGSPQFARSTSILHAIIHLTNALYIGNEENNFIDERKFDTFDVHFQWKLKQTDSRNPHLRDPKDKCTVAISRGSLFRRIFGADIPSGDKEFTLNFVKKAGSNWVRSLRVQIGNGAVIVYPALFRISDLIFPAANTLLAFHCERKFEWNINTPNGIEILERLILYLPV